MYKETCSKLHLISKTCHFSCFTICWRFLRRKISKRNIYPQEHELTVLMWLVASWKQKFDACTFIETCLHCKKTQLSLWDILEALQESFKKLYGEIYVTIVLGEVKKWKKWEKNLCLNYKKMWLACKRSQVQYLVSSIKNLWEKNLF